MASTSFFIIIGTVFILVNAVDFIEVNVPVNVASAVDYINFFFWIFFFSVIGILFFKERYTFLFLIEALSVLLFTNSFINDK